MKRILVAGLFVGAGVYIFHQSMSGSKISEPSVTVNATQGTRSDFPSMALIDEKTSLEASVESGDSRESSIELDLEQIIVATVKSNEPLDEYVPFKDVELTKEQSRVLYNAEEALIKDCMNERGFEYVRNSFDDESLLDYQPETIKRGDIVAASARGYGLVDSVVNPQEMNSDSVDNNLADGLQSPQPLGSNEELVEKLSVEQRQAWNEALMGNVSDDLNSLSGTQVMVENPIDGSITTWDSESCFAIAEDTLYESSITFEENQNVKYALVDQVYTIADADVEYQTALAQWKNCMLSHGYDFEQSGDIARFLIDDYSNGNISLEELGRREIKIASIDATCYQQSSVDKAYIAALQRSEEKLIGENSENIAMLREATVSAIKRAAHID